jgi:hypothetical protein
MSYRSEETDIVVIKLSLLEGQQLSALLEHSIAQTGQGYDPCLLASALDSLGDANDLARWLREDVALELRCDEIVAVLQALESGHECCQKCSSIAAVLGGVCERLQDSLKTRLTTADDRTMSPPLSQFGSSCCSEVRTTAACG